MFFSVTIDHDDPEPVYMQLANIIEAKITSGELRAKQPIPGESHLAGEYGVARMTVRRTVRELRERGLVRVIQGKGTFVNPRE